MSSIATRPGWLVSAVTVSFCTSSAHLVAASWTVDLLQRHQALGRAIRIKRYSDFCYHAWYASPWSSPEFPRSVGLVFDIRISVITRDTHLRDLLQRGTFWRAIEFYDHVRYASTWSSTEIQSVGLFGFLLSLAVRISVIFSQVRHQTSSNLLQSMTPDLKLSSRNLKIKHNVPDKY